MVVYWILTIVNHCLLLMTTVSTHYLHMEHTYLDTYLSQHGAYHNRRCTAKSGAPGRSCRTFAGFAMVFPNLLYSAE